MKRILLQVLSFALFLFSFISLSAQNNCLNFDGKDDYVQFPDFDLYDVFTIEYRFLAGYASRVPFEERIFSLGPTMRLEIGLVEVDDRTVVWFYDQVNGLYNVDYGTDIRDGQWHHCALVYDGEVLQFFLDGAPTNTVPYSPPITPYGPFMRFGAWTGALSTRTFFNGSVDEIRIWDYARTAEQIVAGSSCQISGDEDGILAYWDFNQGTPAGNNADISILREMSGANMDGELRDFTLSGFDSNWLSSPYADVSCDFVSTGEVVQPDTKLVATPNPSAGLFQLTGLEDGEHQAQVYSATGALVRSEWVSNGQMLNLSNLPSGLYLIRVRGKQVLRVVKQ